MQCLYGVISIDQSETKSKMRQKNAPARALGLTKFETLYVVLLNIHKRLPKQRCSSHFARPEEKKGQYTFPGPSPNSNL